MLQYEQPIEIKILNMVYWLNFLSDHLLLKPWCHPNPVSFFTIPSDQPQSPKHFILHIQIIMTAFLPVLSFRSHQILLELLSNYCI